MSGHGWIIPNADGSHARCGGPAICKECALEQAQLSSVPVTEAPEPVKPLRPEDVGEAKTKHFPDAVIEAFNELIAENYVEGTAKVKQKDVVERMVEKGIAREAIYALGYLNVEEMYCKQGWTVSYDKPGYNETYPATYEFSRK